MLKCFSCFQLSFPNGLLHCQYEICLWMGNMTMGGWAVQAHRLSGYSHYPPPQPLAQPSLITLSLVIQQAVNANTMNNVLKFRCRQK